MSVLKYVNYCGLSVIGCCFRSRRGFIPGPVSSNGSTKDTEQKEEQRVVLDTSAMGNECVIVKNGRRICGTGSALASTEIVQDKCYFEVRIQSSGIWAIGVATKSCDLSMVPLGKDKFGWVLRSDGTLAHNDVAIDNITMNIQEGDYVGCSFDHVEVNFFHNGKNLHCPITGVRGAVHPIVCVDDGCIVDVNFDNFVFPPPPGFQKLMIEKDLI